MAIVARLMRLEQAELEAEMARIKKAWPEWDEQACRIAVIGLRKLVHVGPNRWDMTPALRYMAQEFGLDPDEMIAEERAATGPGRVCLEYEGRVVIEDYTRSVA